MKSQKSREDFVKAVYTISQSQNGGVRSWQLAKQLDVSRAIVSRAIKALTQEGYLYFDSHKAVCLTPEGYRLACEVEKRYQILREALLFLGVTRMTAEEDADKLEHLLGEECMAALWAFVQKCRDMQAEERNLCNESL